MSAVLHLVPGPERHGVTRHALDLLRRTPLANHARRRVLTDGDTTPSAVETALGDLPTSRLLHLHLTDHLIAPSAGACAAIVTGLARQRPLSLTLHDLPQAADGPGRFERRRAAYAAMAAHARGVVVASEHERELLASAAHAEGLTLPPVEVVPLPIAAPAPVEGPVGAAVPRRVVVFGYLYPGKGHAEALEALADLPGDVGLLALGQVSPGHDDLVATLTARAHELGRAFEVSGHVPETELDEALRGAALPLAPHRHVSASGSIGSWISAGRRPVVPAGAYVDELDARCPGAVLRYGPGLEHPDAPSALAAALADPDLTRLGDVAVGPDGDTAAAMLADVLDRWAEAT